jgi:transcriptional regulator with XRE-family HTH domain
VRRKIRQQCEENLLALSQGIIGFAMRRAGLNNAQLARKMGCCRSWVTRMMNGDCLITIGTLARALDACGVEVTGLELNHGNVAYAKCERPQQAHPEGQERK